MFSSSLGNRTTLIAIFCVMWMLCYSGESAAQAASEFSIAEGDEWSYYKGTGGPPSKWSYLGYDASGWLKGRTGIGYNTASLRTVLPDMKGNYRTVYARREFIIQGPLPAKRVSLRIICDGAFAAFINGIEVVSNREPVNEQLDISGFTEVLRTGRNVLAIQCSNDDIDSINFTFIPSLTVYLD